VFVWLNTLLVGFPNGLGEPKGFAFAALGANGLDVSVFGANGEGLALGCG
jgi:hypothetical protein